jgi:hypothetical protein
MRAVRLLASFAAVAAAASCALLPLREGAPDAFAKRVGSALERSGLGPDALLIPDNVLRNDAREPPRGAPPIVRELLGRPLAASDAETLFYRTVPGALRRLVDEASAAPRRGGAIPVQDLLDPYVAELARAQRMLRSAARGALDARPVLAELAEHPPSGGRVASFASELDGAALERAVGLFVSATSRFVAALRASQGQIRFPERPMRYDSPIGVIAVGTAGDDVHGPDAALIVDPGGNDVYERRPATDGAVSIIVDLGGDDRYRGSDVVVHGLSAIIDLSGDDRYAMRGPGIAAAVAGASLVLDFAGNDVYEADIFAEGAAALGLGALVDLGGNDRYRVRAGGQGFGMTGGVGLLWDRAGDDAYAAAGMPDAFGRGGGTSWAQGAGFGFRTALGGGVGILRDDAGDDRYDAEMFAQGTAYWYGLGLLWDGRGRDTYRAVRYAQGNGVHEAVGVLRDDGGDDRYEITVGVGQGMGLDLAVGVLYDAGGDDSYGAPAYAQGNATANGVGIAYDAGGADRWHASADRRVWGVAEPLRGLPSVGVIAYDAAGSVFDRGGAPVPAPAGAAMDDPVEPPAASAPPGARCPAAVPAPPEDDRPLAKMLRELAPGVAAGSVDPLAFARVRARLSRGIQAAMGQLLPADDFDVLFSFAEALRCTLAMAPDADAPAIWDELEEALLENPRTPFVGAIIGALRERPPPAAQMLRLLATLDRDPGCGVRVLALRLREANAAHDTSRAALGPAAGEALRSACWQLKSAALGVLRRQGAEPGPGIELPSFLRARPPR